MPVTDILLARNISELRTADVLGDAEMAYVRSGRGRLYAWVRGDTSPDNGSSIIRNDARSLSMGGGAWVAESQDVGANEKYLSDYPNLATAVADLVSGDTLIMDVPSTLTANLTVPASVLLVFRRNAVVTLGAFNLVLNGPIEAGNFQIFDSTGAGAVTLSSGVANVKWWGPDASDATPAFSAALTTAAATNTGGMVIVPSGEYKLSNLAIPNNTWLNLEGAKVKITGVTAASDILLFDTTTHANIIVSGGTWSSCRSVIRQAVPGITISALNDCHFRDMILGGSITRGFDLRTIMGCTFDNINVSGSNNAGVKSIEYGFYIEVDTPLSEVVQPNTWRACRFVNIEEDAIRIVGNGGKSVNTVDSCWFEYIDGNGVYMNGGGTYVFRVVGSYFSWVAQDSGYDINIEWATGGRPRNIVVAECAFMRNDTPTDRKRIHMSGRGSLIVRNNRFRLDHEDQRCISLEGSCESAELFGNEISHAAGTGPIPYETALYERGVGCTAAVVWSNKISDNALLSGATVQQHNFKLLYADPGTANKWQTVLSAAGAVAIDAIAGFNVYHVLTENTVIEAPTNPVDGAKLSILLRQPAGSAFTVGFNAAFHLAGGAFAMTASGGAIVYDTIHFIYNATAAGWFETSRAQNQP